MTDYGIMLIDPQQAISDSKARKDIVYQMYTDKILRVNVDYGVIPGTTKPTLLKPGAERLCSAFHLDAYFDTVTAIEDFDKPLFFYRIRCHLFHVETRLEVATGIGSCNSMESKYRWRDQKRVCPHCGKDAITKGKAEYGGGWICFERKGGCKAKFKDGDPAIEEQAVGQVANDDIYSIVNTIDKMAQKRALIAAVLIGANASEFFTQDLEDMPGFGVVMVEDTPPPGESPLIQSGVIDGRLDPPATQPVPDEQKRVAMYAAAFESKGKRFYRLLDAERSPICTTFDPHIFDVLSLNAKTWKLAELIQLNDWGIGVFVTPGKGKDVEFSRWDTVVTVNK